MHSWVAFTGLLLLWTDAVVSQARVDGVAGQSVTLPCTYSTAGGTTSMCWGRGACPLTRCPNELIWTDGHLITFQKSRRYNLKGMISQGNVSLTIEDAAQSDSGTYCCRVEYSGWFNDLKVNILLDVKPAPPKATSAPTSPRVSTSAPTTAAPTVNLMTETMSSSLMQTTGTQPITTQEANRTSSPSNPCTTGGNSTVMRPSEGGWPDGGNPVNLKEKPWMNTNKALYIGLAATALILLSVLTTVITKRHLCVKRKVLNISKPSPIELLTGTPPNTGTPPKDTAVHYRAEESVHFENKLYSGN
ncbi:hepatitis A virus cellular receptor 1 homolog isoform X2 [Phyllostomus hastatus]|uniref:hepatitis A virus cellular receptor 1 homolog isoform X2 n=1 Tax=Phyllostomus hastatus TaxID=9423 RepID=UPI001E685BFF|nr:hepatitis A virus cellular receptor 1 homolog isoform X2 [Phyllostomus hastatus]